MYCMHCGEQIDDNSRYCRYCGKLVAEDEIRTVNTAEPEYAEGGEEISAYSDDGDGSGMDGSEATTEESAAVNTPESAPKVITEDDIFLEHVSRGKKIMLFTVAVILTVIVAVIVFTTLYPELI